MSTRLSDLIDSVRRQTNTIGSSATSGINDDEFVDYFNEAQERLQSRISSRFSNIFTKEYVFNGVAYQEAYDFPDDVLAVNRIWKLEYSYNGDVKFYYNLKRRSFGNRVGYTTNYPSVYVILGDQILVNPIPVATGGTFRLTYEGKTRTLDIIRGTIESATPSGGYYISVQLANDGTADDDFLGSTQYVSFVTKLGVGTEQLGPSVASYDSTTKIITLDSNVFTDEDTLSAGMKVVGGQYATTHTDLPEICERYLKSFVAWKILRRDSNISDSSPQERELQALENDIEEMFGDNERDEFEIPYSEDIV